MSIDESSIAPNMMDLVSLTREHRIGEIKYSTGSYIRHDAYGGLWNPQSWTDHLYVSVERLLRLALDWQFATPQIDPRGVTACLTFGSAVTGKTEKVRYRTWFGFGGEREQNEEINPDDADFLLLLDDDQLGSMVQAGHSIAETYDCGPQLKAAGLHVIRVGATAWLNDESSVKQSIREHGVLLVGACPEAKHKARWSWNRNQQLNAQVPQVRRNDG